MKLELHLLNCFWLMLPLLAWNLILGPKITDPRITSDDHSLKGLLIAENVMRMIVFALPLLIPLKLGDPLRLAGLIVFVVGTLVYFTSWLPLILAPKSAWSNTTNGLLAPRISPLCAFLGIALIGHSWLYCSLTTLFIVLHLWHGIQNVKKFD